MEKRVVVAKLARTTLTRACAVRNCFIAAVDNGDMNVRFAKAAVTNRNVSSPPFKRERPGNIKARSDLSRSWVPGLFICNS